MKIYLVRHGQTDWNLEGRVMGEKEIPLNSNGLKQASSLGKWFQDKSISRIITSPVSRCVETAKPISQSTGVEIVEDKRLTEVNFGDWTGKIYNDLKKEASFKPYYLHFEERVIPDGEKYIEVKNRVVELYDELVLSNSADVILVSHADPIKILTCNILESPISSSARINISNCSVTLINLGKRPSLEFMNFCPWVK